MNLLSSAAMLSLLGSGAISQQNPGEIQAPATPVPVTTPAGIVAPSTNYGPTAAKCNWAPKAAATAFGNVDNIIPFSWTPIRYQQVFDNGTFANSFLSDSLGLRQDNRFGNVTGLTVEIEVALSMTSYTAATLTNTFATNHTATPTTVINKKKIVLPNMGSAPTNPDTVLVSFPFDTPFPIIASQNLLVDVNQTGNSNNNSLTTYRLDAFNGDTTTTRLYGTSATGTLGRNYGLAMCFGEGCPPATYTYFGKGCPGTGPGPSVVVPANARTVMGNSNNYFPIGRADQRYQQVFVASEFSGPMLISAMSLRADELAGPALSQILTILLGLTTYDPATLTTTFGTNITGAQTTVLPTKVVNLPATTANNDPNNFPSKIPFMTPFVYTGASNLLLEIRNTSASTQYHAYDAMSGAGTNTSRMWAFPATATTGTVQRDYGLVVRFEGPSTGAVPLFSATSLPKLGTNLTYQISSAKPTALCLVLHAISAVDLDLTKAGLPGCSLYVNNIFHVQGAVANAAGLATFGAWPIPNNTAMCGAQYYQQGLVIDSGANSAGLVLTRRGEPTFGS
ncbi:MAG: hypothetical protein KDC95_07685 [Planctomycetes bacterium]|nr:hypothetical protein [Planctomycetota bacterium]